MSIEKEKKLTMAEAAADRGVHPNTIRNWRKRGFNGVQLEFYNVGRKVFTTKQALMRFHRKTQQR